MFEFNTSSGFACYKFSWCLLFSYVRWMFKFNRSSRFIRYKFSSKLLPIYVW